ncbi:hypothetical protein [Capybara microvirus Cap1_SP_94]|nr:hypothetical protein [Capybara microvirus Cap1_SP_94]
MVTALILGAVAAVASTAISVQAQDTQQQQQAYENERLMEKSYQYQRELADLNASNNWELTRQSAKLTDMYQRSLIADSGIMEKRALQNAGLSLGSLANSFTPANSNVSANASSSVPSSPQASVGLQSVRMGDMLQGVLELLSAQKAEAETKKTEAETRMIDKQTEWIDDEKGAAVTKTLADSAAARKSLEVMESQVTLNVTQGELNKRYGERASTEIAKLAEETKGIRINNEYLPKLRSTEIKRIGAETYKAIEEGDATKIRNGFAQLGIGISNDWITTILAMGSRGSYKKVLTSVIDSTDDAIRAALDDYGTTPSAEGILSALGSSFSFDKDKSVLLKTITQLLNSLK